MGNQVVDFSCCDFQPMTISTKPVGLDLEKLGRGGVFISVEKAAVRYRIDGKNATVGIGHIWNDGDNILMRNVQAARELSMRRKDSTDAVIMISYLDL